MRPATPARLARRACLVLSCLVLSLTIGACGGDEPAGAGSEPWQGTTTTEGDVTTVRTESGSVWQGTARLVEELSIGEEIGEEPYMLGRIRALAATDDRIYALDSQVPVVRVYDHDGVHVLDIGGGGQGPGEFDSPRFMALDRVGNVFVISREEIEVFSPDGAHLNAWSLAEVNTSNWPETTNVGIDGTAYVSVILDREGTNPFAWKLGYAEFRDGTEGKIRPLPEFGYEPPAVEMVSRMEDVVMIALILPAFAARRVWAISPDGSILSGSGTDYRFEVHHVDGRSMVVEKTWNRVPVENAEGAWYRDLLRADVGDAGELRGWDPDAMLPTHKPAFEQIVPDESGRIWVIRSGPGVRLPDCHESGTDPDEFRDRPCWVDSALLDVFDQQGRYLGAVEAPEEFSGLTPRIIRPRPFIRGDMMIAAVEDELGTIHLKRYRLVLPH